MTKVHGSHLRFIPKTPTIRTITTETPSSDNVDGISIDSSQQRKWGLKIFRCTYTSQPRWEKYVSLIHHHIRESDVHAYEKTLEDLDCPIIEDREKLDGATWKQARTMFDEMVLADIKADPPSDHHMIVVPPIGTKKRLEFDMQSTPRLQYFIYADQASVDSVVDCTSEHPQWSEGDYWFTVVFTGLLRPQISEVDDNGVWIRDYELDPDEPSGNDNDTWKGLYQKIKLTDFMEAYSEMERFQLVHNYIREDGITDLSF